MLSRSGRRILLLISRQPTRTLNRPDEVAAGTVVRGVRLFHNLRKRTYKIAARRAQCRVVVYCVDG